MTNSSTHPRTAASAAKGLIFAALILPLGAASAPALANGIQMLPPVTEATKTYPDTGHPMSPTPCPAGSPNILTWDGTNPISCATGVTVTNGNVGIGTTSPGQALEVNGSIKADNNFHQGGAYIYQDGSSGTVNSTGGPFIYGDANNTVVKIGSGGGGLAVQNYSGTGEAFFATSGNSYINGGNVGIGTTTPQGALDVENDSNTASTCLNGKCTPTVINPATCHAVTAKGSPPLYVSDAGCADGEFFLNGGGVANQGSMWPAGLCPPGTPAADAIRSGYLHTNRPDADMKGWEVDGYGANLSGDVCTEAYAVCCSL
jgi:hypothetical protein